MFEIVETEIILFFSFLASSVAGFAGAAISVPWGLPMQKR